MREKMVVLEVKENEVVLKNTDEGSCHSCPLHSICKVDPERYTLKVEKGDWDISEGDIVVIKTPRAISSRVSFLLYTIPLLIFISILSILKSLGFSDISSFLFSIGGVGIYYAILKFLDSKLKKRFSPKIVEVIKARQNFQN